ncbi:ankyrin repeat domain-containing protein [Streptomyces sp. CA-111067]|uniref:ankyrin repeat domain-containing protein n=1 Tax=Streptomyces sp. CA-111067 TaxID=3240046 RepID=UPI003D973046
MATASLPQNPDLDQLRNQARELQRAVRAGDPAARARVVLLHPKAPAWEAFRLTAAQLVVAREHGFASWARLRRYVQIVTAGSWNPGRPAPADEPAADRFLRLACLASTEDEAADRVAATRLLAARPHLPSENLLVAAACADVPAVRRHLAVRPAAAAGTGGPHGWSPLLYQAYARHDPGIEKAATLETARLLLDAGADPNDGRFWHALPTPFTVLTGVLGHGEQGRPWHPHAIPFARLLLDAGADPNDGQALYNRMFAAEDDHLVLLFEYGLGRDTNGPWHRLLGESLESPAVMLRSLLAWAITHDQRERVVLLAEHGVDITTRFTEHRSPRRHTPVELAQLNGNRELADRLLALGARPPRLDAADTFIAAVLAGDAPAVRGTPAEVVARVRQKRPGLVTWAAAQGAPGAVELLIAAGFDVNALGRSDILSNMPWTTALHAAAANGDLPLARTLLDLGADPNLRDKQYTSTPLGWARYFDHPALVGLLEPATQETSPEDQE